ncbi:MAG: trypsin-like peptidase domain-containing protein [Pseudomonadota bacterium]
MTESFFLTKTNVDPARLLPVGGTPAVEQFEALNQFLQTKLGRRAADLFAEPVMSRGNGAAETTVSWYVSRSGEGRPLEELPPDSRAAVEGQLRRLLTDASSALSDPDFGPLLGAALHVDNARSVWAVDGHPFLIDWAMIPADAMADPAARERHFGETLGRFLPIAAVPAITRDEWQQRGYAAGSANAGAMPLSDAPSAADPVVEPTAAAAVPPTGAAPAAGATSAAGAVGMAAQGGGAAPPPPGTPVATEEPAGPWRWRWIAPVALLVIFSLGLLWILWPGNLLYPVRSEPSVIEDDALVEAARAANQTLEERIRDLRQAVAGAVCLPDGRLALPDGRTPDGRPAQVPPAAGTPAEGGGGGLVPAPDATPGGNAPVEGGTPPVPDDQTPSPERASTAPSAGPPQDDGLVEVDPDSLTPPSPTEIVTAPPADGGDPVSLLDVIEGRTVMIVAVGQMGAGHGTGFVVGPELVLTNFHVIEPAIGQGRLLVTSEAVGQILPAELVASSGPLEQTGDDFALVKVPGLQAEPYALLRPPATLKLQQVVAAGYPGFTLETDASYDLRALIQGDPSAVPDMVMTQGVINAEQEIGPQSNVVVHTATISSGNSGGPLVDNCGRVVGINTFGKGRILDVGGGQDRSIAWTLNFALASADFIEFLEANGVTPVVAGDACRPLVRAQRPAPAAEDPAGAATPEAPATDADPGAEDGAPAPAAD